MEDVLEQSSAVCTNECAMTKPESALPEKTGTLTHENPVCFYSSARALPTYLWLILASSISPA